MYLRLASTLSAFLLLLVSSGAALMIHERLEHRDLAGPSIAAAGDGIRSDHKGAIVPARPLHSHSHDDCPVCDQLLHLVAVVTVLLFVFDLFAAAITLRPASIDWPALATFASPRSSRGPPLFA